MRLFRDPVWRGSARGAAAPLPGLRRRARVRLRGAGRRRCSRVGPFLDAADVALVRGQLDAVPATGERGRAGPGPRLAVSDGSPPRVEDAVAAAMAGLDGGGPAQEIRQPVGYLNPRDKAAPYVVNPATGERTPGVVFDATGALGALVARGGVAAAGRVRPVAARQRGHPAASGARRPGRPPAGPPGQ